MYNFGILITASTWFLPAIVSAQLIPSFNNAIIRVEEMKKKGYVKNSRLELPLTQICRPKFAKIPAANRLCTELNELAFEINRIEADLFCSDHSCEFGAYYDSSTGLCYCNWGSDSAMDEKRNWPGKRCDELAFCLAPYTAHWNPDRQACSCSMTTFNEFTSSTITFAPNKLKKILYGLAHEAETSPGADMDSVSDLQDIWWNSKKTNHLHDFKSGTASNVARNNAVSLSHYFRETQVVSTIPPASKNVNSLSSTKTWHTHAPRQVTTTTDAISLSPLPTYIPPPNLQVTEELIQESLLLQPQKVASVHSVIPHFSDGVITFLVQLDGPIAQTLALNATDSLPCDTIGLDLQPNLILVPKTVKNGTTQSVLPNCLVIAVNFYDPAYITYWIQKPDGSVFTLLSDSKIHAIDQLDTSQSASVAIRVKSKTDINKRANNFDTATTATTALTRRQIFSINCGSRCPFYHMDRIESGDGYCGCIFRGARKDVEIAERGLEAPTPYTATMTPEVCAAMTCINNGNKPAVFNPFTATCWCVSPTYLERTQNSYGQRM